MNSTQKTEHIEVQLDLELSQTDNGYTRDVLFRDLVETLSNKMYQGVSGKLEVRHRGQTMKMEFSRSQASQQCNDMMTNY